MPTNMSKMLYYCVRTPLSAIPVNAENDELGLDYSPPTAFWSRQERFASGMLYLNNAISMLPFSS